MWIYFSRTVYGISWGSGLKEPFCHFGRIISDRFQFEKIEFPFQEIDIGMLFPSPKVKGEEYVNWNNQPPIYYRGKNLIRVTLPMVEEERALTDVLHLIHKAFDIIISRKKKSDFYDAEKLKQTLNNLEKDLQAADLYELNGRYEALLRQEAIDKRIQERVIREQANDEKNRLIYDLRFDFRFANTDNFYFSPYEGRFCNKILEKLRKRKFRLPNYTHLYIMVSDSFENALYHAVRGADWHIYGIAVLENYTDYATKKVVDKKRIVFELIKQGLNDIAKIDKLDIKTLNEVLAEVEQDIFKKYKYL